MNVARVTIVIDNDVWRAAKVLASSRNETLGVVVSDLVRQALVLGEKASGPNAERRASDTSPKS